MLMPFHVLGGSASSAILRLKTRLGLKWHGWVMKKLSTLTALMDRNGCAVIPARNVFTSHVLVVTQNNRWKRKGGLFCVHLTNVKKNKRYCILKTS